jgi:hypothetical protein
VKALSSFSAILFLACVGVPGVKAQDPAIQEIINAVSVDSLVATVRVLSGEVGSQNGGTTDTIYSRWRTAPGNALAAEYLRQRLASLGLTTQRHEFLSFFGVKGANILAEQRGEHFPPQKYIVCGHFDSCTDSNNVVAPGADDNASGCAAVLEVARLLSRYRTAYTVTYAFWDQEELGLVGSYAYAKQARDRGDSILGVINLDVIGYDSDNDSLMAIVGIKQLGDTLSQVNDLCGVGLKCSWALEYPFATSDHQSFAWENYSSVWIAESPFDHSPYHHTSTDRLEYFNLSYFYRMAKLAAGSIAFLAGIQGALAVPPVKHVSQTYTLDQNYPNPFNPTTVISYQLPVASDVNLVVFDMLGREVSVLVNERRETGVYQVKFDGLNLSSGVYLYRLAAGDRLMARKMILMK